MIDNRVSVIMILINEQNSQQDVRLGHLEGPQVSLDLDESGSAINTQLSSSPPNTGRASPTQPTTPAQIPEPMELQVDYWPMLRPVGDGKDKNQTKGQDQGKNSVKSTFRNLQVNVNNRNFQGFPRFLAVRSS